MSGATTADTDVAVLDSWFAAFNAHDVEALLELAHPGIEVFPLGEAASVPAGVTYHGHEGLLALMAATFERFPLLRLDHSEPRRSGHRITVDLEFVLDDGESRPAVRTAACEYRISDGLIRRIRSFEREPGADPGRHRGRAAALSPRERQVLSMLAGGQTVAEIANELVLSPLTVRTHVRNAKDKLQARTTAHAVALALDEHALDV